MFVRILSYVPEIFVICIGISLAGCGMYSRTQTAYYETLLTALEALSSEKERVALLSDKSRSIEFESFQKFLYETVENYLTVQDFDRAFRIRRCYDEFGKALNSQVFKGFGFIVEGNIYKARLEYQQATAAYLQAQTLFAEQQDHANLAKALTFQGELHKEQERLPDALLAHQQALSLRSAGDAEGQATSYCNICEIFLLSKLPYQALDHCREALKLTEQHGYAAIKANILGNMSVTYQHLGRSHKASEYFKESWKLFQELQNEGSDEHALKQAHIFNNMSLIEAERGEFDVAQEHINRALEMIPAKQFTSTRIRMLNTFGTILQRLGALERALTSYQQALQFASGHQELYARLQPEILGNLGSVYYQLAMLSEGAIEDMFVCFTQQPDQYTACLTRMSQRYCRRGTHGASGNASCRASLGQAAKFSLKKKFTQAAGSYRRALLEQASNAYHRALRQNADRHNLQGVAIHSGNLGLLAYVKAKTMLTDRPLQGIWKLVAAWGYYQFALQCDRAIDDVPGEAYDLGNLGDIYYQLGFLQYALKHYDRQLEIATTSELRSIILFSHYRRGKVFEKQGQLLEAIEAYKRSIDVLEQIRARMSSEFRISFLENKMQIYHDLVLLLFQSGAYEEALYYAEKAKSRQFLELLISRTSPRPDAGWFQRDQELLEQFTHDSSFPATKRPHSRQRKVASQSTASAYERVDAFPVPEALFSKKTLPVTEFQQILPPNVTALEYFVTEREILVWVITRNHIFQENILRKKDLSDIQSIQKAINIFTDRRIYQRGNQGERLAQDLYQQLLSPVRDYLQDTEIVLILPHGPLHYLPFHALKETRYLIEDFQVVYAPSYSAFAELIQRPSLHDTAVKALVVGNPDGTLPQSEAEAKEIGHMFSPNATVLIGQQAAESRIKSIGGQYVLLHFGTHHYVNHDNPLFSGIQLAPGDTEDGLLKTYEILGLDLRAVDLLTLSACQSFKGRITEGDDIIGVTMASFSAGASSMLASLWDVSEKPLYSEEPLENDRPPAARLLMKHFYHNWQNRNMTKSAALQQAIKVLLDTEPTVTPADWGLFVFIGNYQ